MHRRHFVRGAALAAGGLSLPDTLAASAGLQTAVPQSSSLPLNDGKPFTDADVLAQAKANIPKVRQQTCAITLTDWTGKPLKNASVRFQQVQSDFAFGENNYSPDGFAQDGMWNSRAANAWRTLFPTLYNALNNTCYWTERHDNSMKRVEEHQGDVRLDSFEQVVQWANANGIMCKGHPVFWPVEKAIPKWLRRYDYPTQLKFLEVRVRSLIARFKGQVQTWDLVNEMMWEPALKNLNKRNWPHLETEENLVEYISQILTWAREEDPTAVFLLNEYGVEADEKPSLKDQFGRDASSKAQRARYVSLYKALRKAGTLPNAIGLQSHSGPMLTPAQQWQVYDDLKPAGVPVHVTEFWVPETLPDELQASGLSKSKVLETIADRVCDYVTAAFGHTDIAAFYGWNLMRTCVERKNEEKGAYILLPTYHRLVDLLRKQWRTDVTLKTDERGVVNLTGFTGHYHLSLPAGKTQAGTRLDLKKGMRQLDLALPVSF